jgi:cell wall arabinan synthesis protein/EmbC-like arabinotransferase in arabinogalactan biosynthesis/arabinosyltransferase-like concanavalin domain-containing protein
VLAALALPFAPVSAERATVSWPGAGRPVVSSTAFFAPYRPVRLAAEVPCPVLRAAAAAQRPVTVLDTASAGAGLLVRAVDGGTQVLLNGRLVATAAAPAGADCGVSVVADQRGALVTVAAGQSVTLDREPVPQVQAFRTELAPADAAGLTVTADTQDPFRLRAGGLKRALLAVQLLAAAAVLAWLCAGAGRAWVRRARAGRVSRRGLADRAGRRGLGGRIGPRLAGWGVDLGVLGTLGGWAVVGPLSDDDGFAAMIARNSLAAGYQGNYYRWWNASETPFALAQHVLAPLTEVSIAPLWLRLPSTLLAALTWFALSRGIVAAALPELAGRASVRLLSAGCLLACWLPFDLGVRPEAYLAAGLTGVLALLWRARGPAALGAATLLAALSVSASPSSVLLAAPVLVFAPRIVRIVRAGRTGAPAGSATVPGGPTTERTAGRLEGWAVAAALCCVGGVACTLVFADQSWHALVTATRWHTDFGPSLPWYDELARYTFLLGDDQDGTATKRVPVLLAVALLPVVGLLLARRAEAVGAVPGERPVGPAAARLAGVTALGLGLFWLTPSKWSHHFGSLAGVFAGFLVVALVLLVRCARRAPARDPAGAAAPGGSGTGGSGPGGSRPAGSGTGGAVRIGTGSDGTRPSVTGPGGTESGGTGPGRPLPCATGTGGDRVARGVGLAGGGLVAVLAGLAFSGPNAWWQPVLYDVPWAAGPVRPAGLPLDSPLLWAGAAVLGYLVVRLRRGAGAAGRSLLAAPAVLAAAVLAVSVAVLLGSFVAAPLRQPVGSLALVNLRWLAGHGGCGLADDIQVLPDVPGGVLVPAGPDPAALHGFAAGAGFDPTAPPPDPPGVGASTYLWGSLTGGSVSTGSLASPWFVLPNLPPDRQLAVSVAGRTDGGNRMDLEFGRAVGGRVIVLGDAVPPDPLRAPAGGTADYRLWRAVGVGPDAVPPGADRVRVTAVDGTADPDGWLAVSGPRLREVLGLNEFLGEHRPVLVNWPIAFLFPCVIDPVTVHNGLAEAPAAVLEAPVQYAGLAAATTEPTIGGDFAPLRTLGGLGEETNQLAGRPGTDWGDVLLTHYPAARDQYEVTTTWVPVSAVHG